MRSLLKSVVVSFVGLLSMMDVSARTWTSVDGKKIEAEFVRAEGVDKVVVKMRGKEYTLPLSGLSVADRDYVREMEENGGNADNGEGSTGAPAVVSLKGVELKPGRNVIPFELDEDALKQLDKENREHARKAEIILFIPNNFRPKAVNNLMVTTNTSSGKASQAGSIGPFGQRGANAGWVVMTADSVKGRPPEMTMRYRLIMINEALEIMRAEWPESSAWNLSLGGFSGGAKAAQMLLSNLGSKKWGGYRIVGLFITGCNECTLADVKSRSEASRKSQLRNVAVFMSQGKKDSIAPPKSGESVMAALKDLGLRTQKYELFDGGHNIHGAHVDQFYTWVKEHISTLDK